MPNNDGGACAGAWASTSLPRLCASVSHRKETAAEPPGRAKVSTRAAHPAMGWTSPLPAMRMRAAMFVSAVVATCRGRLRRGAIREEVLADEPHEWFRRSSCEGCQPDCLRVVPAASQCPRTQYKCDDAFLYVLPVSGFAACGSYWSEAASARARSVAPGCGFQTAGRSGTEHAVQ